MAKYKAAQSGSHVSVATSASLAGLQVTELVLETEPTSQAEEGHGSQERIGSHHFSRRCDSYTS